MQDPDSIKQLLGNIKAGIKLIEYSTCKDELGRGNYWM